MNTWLIAFFLFKRLYIIQTIGMSRKMQALPRSMPSLVFKIFP